jgi:hypothetical protein
MDCSAMTSPVISPKGCFPGHAVTLQPFHTHPMFMQSTAYETPGMDRHLASADKPLHEDNVSALAPSLAAILPQDGTAAKTVISEPPSGRRCRFRFWRWAVPSVLLVAAVATQFLWSNRRTAAACVHV